MDKATVLVVEDEAKIAGLLEDYLQQVGGYQTHWLDRGDEVIEHISKQMPDLILLDLMLPGMDGISVCKAIREISRVPIVMVTARVEEIDRLLGLELGADDYICKPFSPREVVARVKAILRRVQQPKDSSDTGLKIDRDTFSVSLDDQPVKLTPVEFALLDYLAATPGRVYSRSQLMDEIYQDYRVVSDRTVDTHVKNLRKKLAEIVPEKEMIESIYGVGYRLLI